MHGLMNRRPPDDQDLPALSVSDLVRSATKPAGRLPAGTRPSALRTLNVDTPVAAAISRSVAPAASSPAIRSTSSGVSFEAPLGPRRAGTSPATPSAASA